MSSSDNTNIEHHEEKSGKKWFPLESNPDVINPYIKKMGFNTDKAKFYELFSTEDWALEMVPQPVLAVLVLFPIKEVSENFKKEEENRINNNGQIVSDKVYFMKQTVGNACGTIGLLHALGNVDGTEYPPEEGSFLQTFLEKTKDKTPEEIADILENDESVEEVHSEAADGGQTQQVSLEEQVNTHFICLSHVDGHLYEFDGRKNFPINHGVSSPETILTDACRVVKEMMDRDPGELRFTMTVLSAGEPMV